MLQEEIDAEEKDALKVFFKVILNRMLDKTIHSMVDLSVR